MDQIAIISDIHGNMPALEAVLQDIQRHGISRIMCLGDIAGKGPSSDRVVDTIRSACEQVVKGNWDDLISQVGVHDFTKWHQELMGSERLEYLGSLPFSIEFMMSGRFVRLFHASPRSMYERVQPWDDEEQRKSLFAASDLSLVQRSADVAGYGDIHNAFLQNLGGRTLFNAGSVGNPLDITQASYVILEGEYGGETPAPFSIRFERVPYDIEQAVQQAVEAQMPYLEPYIRELRTAQYRGLPQPKQD